MQVIGVRQHARRVVPRTELAELDVDRCQGTNLQHALMLAGRFIDKHPDAEPVVLLVTDGEPTAHLTATARSCSTGRRRPRRSS